MILQTLGFSELSTSVNFSELWISMICLVFLKSVFRNFYADTPSRRLLWKAQCSDFWNTRSFLSIGEYYDFSLISCDKCFLATLIISLSYRAILSWSFIWLNFEFGPKMRMFKVEYSIDCQSLMIFRPQLFPHSPHINFSESLKINL